MQNARIHAIDPRNFSMPKYSMKYKNEANMGAVRHLMGGVGEVSNKDLSSSVVHWQLGLRNYQRILKQ